jgi:hypothetical protein
MPLCFLLCVLKLERGVKVCGFVKFAAYTCKEFVLVIQFVPRHFTDTHEGRQ